MLSECPHYMSVTHVSIKKQYAYNVVQNWTQIRQRGYWNGFTIVTDGIVSIVYFRYSLFWRLEVKKNTNLKNNF